MNNYMLINWKTLGKMDEFLNTYRIWQIIRENVENLNKPIKVINEN